MQKTKDEETKKIRGADSSHPGNKCRPWTEPVARRRETEEAPVRGARKCTECDGDGSSYSRARPCKNHPRAQRRKSVGGYLQEIPMGPGSRLLLLLLLLCTVTGERTIFIVL